MSKSIKVGIGVIVGLFLTIVLICCYKYVSKYIEDKEFRDIINKKYDPIYLDPDATPSGIDRKLDTHGSMRSMVWIISMAMKNAKNKNLLNYLNSLSDTKDIPRILDYEVIELIFKDSIGRPTSFRDKKLLDTWERPIIITLTTNRSGKVGITMHSFGENGIDENGEGDDIIMWFDADMFRQN